MSPPSEEILLEPALDAPRFFTILDRDPTCRQYRRIGVEGNGSDMKVVESAITWTGLSANVLGRIGFS